MSKNEGKQEQQNCYFFKEDTLKEEITQAIFENQIPLVIGTAGYAKKQIIDVIMEEALEREQKVLLISENIKNAENEDFQSQDASVFEQIENTYTDFILYDELSEEEKEQILPLVKNTLTKYENLWNMTQKLRNHLQLLECHLEESSEKEILQQMVMIAKIIKKCPVYQKMIHEVLQTPQSDGDSAKKELLRQLEELSYLNPGRPKYTKKKEKITDKFLSKYDAGEVYNFFKELNEEKERTLEKISQLEVFCKEDGTVYLGKMSIKERKEQSVKFEKFLTEVAYSLQEETEEVQEIIKNVIAKIVAGEEQELKEVSEELTMLYADYVQDQTKLSEKIVKNQEGFTKEHPTLLKKVLFEEWMQKYENNLYKESDRTMEEQVTNVDLDEFIKEIECCDYMTPLEVKNYTFLDFPRYDIVVIESELQLSIYDALIPMSKANCCVIFTNQTYHHEGETENE